MFCSDFLETIPETICDLYTNKPFVIKLLVKQFDVIFDNNACCDSIYSQMKKIHVSRWDPSIYSTRSVLLVSNSNFQGKIQQILEESLQMLLELWSICSICFVYVLLIIFFFLCFSSSTCLNKLFHDVMVSQYPSVCLWILFS